MTIETAGGLVYINRRPLSPQDAGAVVHAIRHRDLLVDADGRTCHVVPFHGGAIEVAGETVPADEVDALLRRLVAAVSYASEGAVWSLHEVRA